MEKRERPGVDLDLSCCQFSNLQQPVRQKKVISDEETRYGKVDWMGYLWEAWLIKVIRGLTIWTYLQKLSCEWTWKAKVLADHPGLLHGRGCSACKKLFTWFLQTAWIKGNLITAQCGSSSRLEKLENGLVREVWPQREAWHQHLLSPLLIIGNVMNVSVRVR